jgi:hypothetical protein
MNEIYIVRFRFKEAAINKTKFVFGFKCHGNGTAPGGIVISIKRLYDKYLALLV